MGEHAVYAFAIGDAYHVQSLDTPGFNLLVGKPLLVVKLDYLVQLCSDSEYRVKAGHRLLEDHGDGITSQLLHAFLGDFANFISLVTKIKVNLTINYLTLRSLKELHKGKACYGFAAS